MLLPSFLIFDDFVANPRELRRQALELGYSAANKAGNYPGITSERALPIPGLDDFVSRAIGTRVRAAPDTLHGHCRLTMKADRGLSGVHVDPAFYSGILYLSLPEHAQGGTDFYRHKRTGLERIPEKANDILAAGYGDVNDLIEDVVNKDTLRPAAWERSFSAPMRFNRLILFSPMSFHNSARGFGDRPENARLVYLMFFAAG
jgi:hypothetical protein